MSSITQQVETILDKRLGRKEYANCGRLQQIENKITALKNVRENIAQFEALVKEVTRQWEQKSGPYYQILLSDPEALQRFQEVSCNMAKAKLNETIDDLRRLKIRFERKALRIAFIGYERQGKSTFLQSMTGLPNEVIPAYDGTSCTGAVSIIHNSDNPFYAEIEFCTVTEFIENVKSKLKGLFPDRNFSIHGLEDLKNINISDYQGNYPLEVKRLIGENIIGKMDVYSPYLGIGKKTYDNKDLVMEFVAQYREYSEIPAGDNPNNYKERIKTKDENGNPLVVVWRKPYYKYLAVKSVNIYCKFEHQDCGKIEFVDTIGLGASINPEGIEREMFRVLREDCDAAIDVFCPAPTGGSLNQYQKDIFEKIRSTLSDRNPRKWIVYAMNGIPSGEKANIQNFADIQAELNEMERILPFGFSVEVNAANRNEVNTRLLEPLLKMITQNLDELDVALMKQANDTSASAYNECLSLIKAASSVISASAAHGSDMLSLFDEKLFQELRKSFALSMNQLDINGYARQKEKPCIKLAQAYEGIISSIDEYLPDEEVIFDRFMTGSMLTPNQLFEEYTEQMRNNIFNAFEHINISVLHPLQETVKTDIIKILYNEGRLGKLPILNHSEEMAHAQ